MSNAYGRFAEYYDLLGWNAFARHAAVRLRAFFKIRGIKPKSILDLACGTGGLEKKLSDSGLNFVGVDTSGPMLKMARAKKLDVRFIRGDAAAVRLHCKFDMVLLLFDSANHMRSLNHLNRVFANARRHLKDGGFFIFDFIPESGMGEWEQVNIKRTPKFTLFFYGHYYHETMTANIFIEAFVKRGKLYDRVFQKIVERTYLNSDIIDGLAKSGFSKILVSPYDHGDELENASRLWFVCS
jgi:SAM-dependent methyltransferase